MTEKEKETNPRGYGFLKQIKATPTCPTSASSLVMISKKYLGGLTVHMELRCTTKGFYIFQERIFQDISHAHITT